MPKLSCPFALTQAEFEIGLYELGLEDDPNNLEVLEVLAYAYTAVGRYGDGLRADLRLVEALPDNPHCLYNLACSYSLIGDAISANDTLRRAILHGYREFKALEADDDLVNARNHPSYAKVASAIGRHREDA